MATDSLRAGGLGAGQGFGGGQQVRQPFHPDHPGPAQRRVEHRIRPSRRVGQAAAGVDRHHRAQPGRGAGGGQETAPVGDAAYVEQDGAGVGIAG
jgi:hypothetical protein